MEQWYWWTGPVAFGLAWLAVGRPTRRSGPRSARRPRPGAAAARVGFRHAPAVREPVLVSAGGSRPAEPLHARTLRPVPVRGASALSAETSGGRRSRGTAVRWRHCHYGATVDPGRRRFGTGSGTAL
ncbi:hypothetical protein [Nakamurella endophytica]|nr:hypothetical protein [Nakamurella endophytica]